MLLILGASTRAAAFSALRSGCHSTCADLFADSDLRAIGPAHRVALDDYPEALARVAEALPRSPWIYTGSLENHPDLVDRIARQRPLWGNHASTLRAVRDPIALASTLTKAGLHSPSVRLDPGGLPRDGSWLVKPLASGGGRGIVPLGPDEGHDPPGVYYQERIAGPSLAAVFVAAGGREAETRLAGVTRQFLGVQGQPFAYAGSLGPWPIAAVARARIESLGRAIADGFGLVGLFGVDLILRDGVPWPVEVNPRYTASVEVIELAQGRALLSDHARACDPEATFNPGIASGAPRPRPTAVGKLIVFAPGPCEFPGTAARRVMPIDPFAVPRLGDVPDAGTRFEAGEPVLTLFARGPTVAACWERLEHRRTCWVRRLASSAG